MNPNDRDEMLRTARLYEASGKTDEAARIFAAAGSLEDAARVLSSARKFKEAGDLLLRSLQVEPATVKNLPPALRKYAFNAAICYGRAQETQTAVTIFLALKEERRAAELLERAGDRVGAARLLGTGAQRTGAPAALKTSIGGQPITQQSALKLEQMGKPELALEMYAQLKRFADAARLSEALGRTADAAAFYADAGRAFEAGRAYAEIGDTAKAIENWVRVPRQDPNYRAAAVEVIRFARALDALDLPTELFLGKFVDGGPRDAKEVESFYLLARLYQRHDLLENAKEALRLLLRVAPGYRDAAALLAQYDRETTGSAGDFAKILKQDESFRQAAELNPQLPELPDLPSLPSLPSTGPLGLPNVAAAPPGKAPTHPPAPVSVTTGGSAREDDWSQGTQRRITQDQLPAAATGDRMPVPPPGTALPQASALLGGRYRVIKQIGKGGMATVFHVEDTELSEEVALKLFNAGDDDPAALARFRQELKLSRQLVHPNIVRLYDIGVDQGRRYLTMELLSGRDLHAFMGRPMAFGRGLNYLMQACAGLFAAHQQGVVHRDIKPENLFITDKGVLKVMDFGIAKGQVKSGMTMEGVTAGTPKYMSPEQINSFGQVTAATDLYAMGIVAYEMFTGRCPFDGDQLMHILMAQMSQPPPPPRQFNAAIPEALERIILKCLEKDPTQRFATARDLAMALDPLRRHFEGQ